MEINFSDTDLIFMYARFRKESRKLKEIRDTPNCPISPKNINQEIQLYDSLADKLRDACPGLKKLDDYRL